MGGERTERSSRAALANHPLHPMAVSYPISLLTLVLLADLAYWLSGLEVLAYASLWLCALGLIAGLGAAGLGIVDFFFVRPVRRLATAWSHFLAGVMVLAVAGMNVALRWEDPVGAVLPWGLVSAALLFVMVALTGWLGGTLSFGHGIGSYEAETAEPGGPADAGHERPD